MESDSQQETITLESLKAELVKRTMELVNKGDTFDFQKKTKVEFKNLHGVAKKLKEKLVCGKVIGYNVKDASEAELAKLKESTDIPTSTQGDDQANAYMDSVIGSERTFSCRE